MWRYIYKKSIHMIFTWFVSLILTFWRTELKDWPAIAMTIFEYISLSKVFKIAHNSCISIDIVIFYFSNNWNTSIPLGIVIATTEVCFSKRTCQVWCQPANFCQFQPMFYQFSLHRRKFLLWWSCLRMHSRSFRS